MLSGSVHKLKRVTERFLNGFRRIAWRAGDDHQNLRRRGAGPAKEMAGLYAAIEGSTGHRDAQIWTLLGKSREAFTAMLVAANSINLSLATASAEEALRTPRRSRKPSRNVGSRRQRQFSEGAAAIADAGRGAAPGLAKLSGQVATRAHCCRMRSMPARPKPIGAIDEVSGQHAPARADGAGDVRLTLADISHKVLSIAMLLLGLILVAGVVIALSIRLPLQQIMAAMQAITSGDYELQVQGANARDEVGAMARAVEVFRENAIAKRKTEDELRASKETGGGRAARIECRPAEPDRCRTAGGAGRSGRRRHP